ncbi:MAG: DUF3565 domain-containing protein [Gemmatimonadota bacterium]|nr:DUF3565 domain-containing protein [Gemmatimonadota bacterium]
MSSQASSDRPGVPRRITGFHTDAEMHWVADLECGHTQHVRHDPPWQERPWVLTLRGRQKFTGSSLLCVLCEPGESSGTISEVCNQ